MHRSYQQRLRGAKTRLPQWCAMELADRAEPACFEGGAD